MTRTRASTDVGKAKKVECFRFSKPPSCSTLSREATELDNTSLLRMQRQSELHHSFVQILKKTPGLVFVFKSGAIVVGVSHKHDLSESVTVSPPISPKVEAVMKVDVGEHRRNHAPNAKGNRNRFCYWGVDPLGTKIGPRRNQGVTCAHASVRGVC
jgi:hypothetical protein